MTLIVKTPDPAKGTKLESVKRAQFDFPLSCEYEYMIWAMASH